MNGSSRLDFKRLAVTRRRVGLVEIEKEVLERGRPPVPTNESLGTTPTRDEIRWAILEMRESAAGKDEISVNLIKFAGEAMMEEVLTIVQSLWQTAYQHWDREAKVALGILLYKGKGPRTSPDKYRQIVLISILLRIVARLVAKRLLLHAEEHHILPPTQFGLRR